MFRAFMPLHSLPLLCPAASYLPLSTPFRLITKKEADSVQEIQSLSLWVAVLVLL